MKYLENVYGALKEVYGSKTYVVAAGIVAMSVILFNALVINYRIFFNYFSFTMFFSLLKGAFSSMTAISIAILAAISILAGIVAGMTLFLVRRQIKVNVKAGSSGILVGLIAPSCPSCAMGLLSALGMSGFLSVLPFKGLELGFLGIGLLSLSTIYLSNKITTKTCDIATVRDSQKYGGYNGKQM